VTSSGKLFQTLHAVCMPMLRVLGSFRMVCIHDCLGRLGGRLLWLVDFEMLDAVLSKYPSVRLTWQHLNRSLRGQAKAMVRHPSSQAESNTIYSTVKMS